MEGSRQGRIQDLAGEVYVRKFKNLTVDDASKWEQLRDVNEDIPEGFGVKVDWL